MCLVGGIHLVEDLIFVQGHIYFSYSWLSRGTVHIRRSGWSIRRWFRFDDGSGEGVELFFFSFLFFFFCFFFVFCCVLFVVFCFFFFIFVFFCFFFPLFCPLFSFFVLVFLQLYPNDET